MQASFAAKPRNAVWHEAPKHGAVAIEDGQVREEIIGSLPRQ